MNRPPLPPISSSAPTRRRFLIRSLVTVGTGAAGYAASLAAALPHAFAASTPTRADKVVLSDAEWRKRLTPAQYRVLRDEGTEPAGSSVLDREKRRGTFHCAGCDLPLFSSEMKYDSGTGWPSFFSTLPDAVGTKTDYKLVFPRTEYHCARCGGHQGHLFTDGPRPTGKRYCNNGTALRFEALAA